MSQFERKLHPVGLPAALIAALASFALFLSLISPSLAATSGPRSPGTCVDIGGGDIAWESPGSFVSKAKLDEGKGKPDSNILRCTGFGFSLPPGATIDGIIVTIDGHARNESSVVDLRVRLVKAGVAGATDRSSSAFWPKKQGLLQRGGATDLWGDVWTDADINAANFGMEIAVRAVPGSPREDVHLHDITITVFHDGTACGTIPADYPIYAAGGLHWHNDWVINGNKISGSGNALQPDGVLVTASQSLPAIVPATFPPNTSNINVDTNSTNPVPAGDYDTVDMKADISVFSGGTYHIKTLKAKGKKDAYFAPGDYFIDQIDWDKENDIVISPAGVVRIFINTSFDVKDKANFNVGGATENLQIYVYDGAQVKFDNDNVVNGLIYGAPNTKIEMGDNNSLTGAIISDGEVRIHKKLTVTYSAGMQAAIGSIELCNTATVDNFLIEIGSSSGSTCSPKNITITARDSGNVAIPDYAGTINITTSTNHGDWAKLPGFGGTLTNPPPDDGAATYVYDPNDDGVVTLTLSNTHADDLTITVVDVAVPASVSTSAAINFRDNAFVISAIDSLGNVAVAGRNHALRAEMWRRDPVDGDCAVDANYNGNKSLDAWYVADADHPAGAAAPTISTGTPPATCGGAPSLTLGTAVPPINPGANNLANVPFSNGVWDFCLSTTDVGKFAINLRDDTRSHASGVDISSDSSTLTVRPFGLAIVDVRKGATLNPAGTATSGAGFVPAGNTAQVAARYQVTVAAHAWQAADDADNDGIPDSGANITNNAVTARFAWPTALSVANTAPYFTPAAGVTGVLTGTTSLTAGSYSVGQATANDLAYSEVGSIQMRASVVSYLNTPGVDLVGVNVDAAGLPTQIGRFYPDHFTLLGGSSVADACPGGAFTYMSQPQLGVSFIVEARNTADVRTSNYGAGYAVGTVTMVAENNDDGVDRSARLNVPGSSWVAGAYDVNTVAASFSRAAAPDGPYDLLQLGVQVSDPDLALLAGRDMNPGTSGACAGACTAKALSGFARLRFGRLRMFNVSGTSRLGLPLRVQAQYYTPTGFVINGDDDCTVINGSDLAMAFVASTNLAACETAASPSAAIAFSGGQAAGVQLAAPGIGNDGSVDLRLNLGAASGTTCTAVGASTAPATSSSLDYLRGNWGGTAAWDQDPVARATFGVYRNAAEFLYLQENY